MDRAAEPNRHLTGRLPRWARMRHTIDFERVRTHGQAWRHPLFVLAACRNDQGLSRIGVVASRKIGKAVKRNRARRLLREASRLLYHHMLPGWDIVLVARVAIVETTLPHVYAALAHLAGRAGLLGHEIQVHPLTD